MFHSDWERSGPLKPSQEQLKRLFAIMHRTHWVEDEVRSFCKEFYGVDSMKDLTYQQYDEVCARMESGGFIYALEMKRRGTW